MKAITIRRYGGPDELVIEDIPVAQPASGDVVVKVKAFGLNRAELYMRQGVWGDVASVPGIECVGEVVDDRSAQFEAGQKVAALMGGMGRTINGSYAEYVTVPGTNVVAVESRLSWAELAAIPESYATAWTCLHRNIGVMPGQTIVVRGAGSALGQAALNIAADLGVKVIATTTSSGKIPLLGELGAARVLLEQPALAETIRRAHPSGIDAVLDIVGTTTILDSMAMVRREGRVCMAGFLGGNEPLKEFNPLIHLPSSVGLSFFASFMFGTPGFPLSEVPLGTLIDRVAVGAYKARPTRIFSFHEVPEAHRLMEAHKTIGKCVVLV